MRALRGVALGAPPVALISTLIVFLMTYLATANPAAQKLGDTATPADIARLNAQWGLDRGFFEQYGSWLWNAVHGNLGVSYFSDVPVADSIGERLPVDLSIAVVAVVVAVLAGFAFRIIAAVRRDGMVDRAVTPVSWVLVTIPEFWLAIMAIVVFSVT